MALTERKSVHRILREAGAPDWFMDFGVIRLNGVVVPREQWRHVKVKPDAKGLLELCVVPQKGKLLPIIASVALVAATAGIGTFGIPFLGIAAGSFASSAAAAAVGIAGQIAISQLTAPPSQPSTQAQREFSQAGIQANQVNLFEPLPVIFGKMLVSPSIISPAYTTFDNEELTVHGIVGVQGRCLIENILINGTDIDLLESIEYETREGGAGDAALTLAQLTCIQQTEAVALSTFRTQQESTYNDVLVDQATPANSSPDYHPFTTDGEVDEIWIRLLFPAGIVDAASSSNAFVPIRLEARKVGDSTWRNFPTMHIQDTRNGNGPLRVEIKLKFQTQASGRHFSNASAQYPIFELTNVTGIGQAFEYEADTYFQQPSWTYRQTVLPVMTAATTSGVTMSASSTNGTDNAWKAADNSFATYWRPANNSLPADHITDLGSAQTIRSYYLVDVGAPTSALATTTMLTKFYWSGSNNGVDYTRLDDEDVDQSDYALPIYIGQIGNPGSYRYYKLTVLANNGAASQDTRLAGLYLSTLDAAGSALGTDYLTLWGDWARHTSGALPRCVYGSLDKNGATFYLDPAQWLPGAYEVRLKRGWGQDTTNFDPLAYRISGSTTSSDFFEHFTSSGKEVIRYGQKDFRSDVQVEAFSSVSYDVPVDTTGIACIAFEMKNTQINSISAEFTRYAPIYSGGVWTDAEQPTSNPAALYRALELGAANPVPTPGEIVDEDAFAVWHTRCAALGYESNFIAQSKSLAEVKQILASCGYASPRDTNLVSIAEDFDRSGDVISQMLSPLNSRNAGTDLTLPRLPHALYAEYFDAADDWKIKRDIVYRDGFDAGTASRFDTVTYDGFTNASKVAARAAFDLLQMQLRSRAYSREIGIEGYSLKRGDLVGLNDDTLDRQQACGLIRSIQTSGGNITGITVDTIIALSGGQDSFEDVDDVSSLTDVLDTDEPFGVAIRIADGTSTARPLSNVTDSNVCTFTTPFTESGSGIEVGQLAVFGISGREYRRAIVVDVTPNDLETRTLILRDEAPELFA